MKSLKLMAKIKKEEEKPITPEDQLKSFLNTNKEDHYNYNEEKDYRISSGSLSLDLEMGGIRPSVTRFSGCSESGKSNCALSFMRNFLMPIEGKRGVYIKAEGRLSQEIIDRSGVKFVDKEEDFKDGTCFVLKTNIYEIAIGLTRLLVKNNPQKKNYFFVYDSMDALLPKGDEAREPGEANKVSGAAVLSTDFLRRMALAFATCGHVAVIISQVRSPIQINPYAKQDFKMTNASGGNALLHYSDWILEFQPHYNKDVIWEGEENKSKRLGHYCKIIFRKSTNEKTGMEVRYPIKYGQKGGNSIWREIEVLDLAIAYDYIKKSGKWFEFNKQIIDKLKEQNIEVEEQYDGLDDLKETFLTNKELVDYFHNEFKKTIESRKNNTIDEKTQEI